MLGIYGFIAIKKFIIVSVFLENQSIGSPRKFHRKKFYKKLKFMTPECSDLSIIDMTEYFFMLQNNLGGVTV